VASNSPVRQPIYFGPPSARCFGFLHHPAAPARRVGVILCDSIGYDSVSLRRTLRHTAERLAAAGFATLRFDYPGTGDSVGSERDPARLRAWLDGIHAARAALAARAGVTGIALVGLRMGATLAALAGAECAQAAERAAGATPAEQGLDALVLWAPATRGRAFVREKSALAKMAADEYPDTRGPDVVGDPGDINAAGYVLTVETAAELGKLDLTKLGARPAPHVLVMPRGDRASEDALVARLQALGAEVSVEGAPGYDDMMAEPHKTEVPDAAIELVRGWLDARFPERDGHALEAADATTPEGPPVLELEATPDAPHRAPLGAPTRIAEEPIAFGPDQRLFGILSRPAAPAPAERPVIVLLNAGAVHHVATNRMSVSLARSLSALGFVTFRIDLGGLGDSAPEPGSPENVTYTEHGMKDVDHAYEALRQRLGATRFVLAGLCSGGHFTFRGAVRGAPLVGAVLLNPYFYVNSGSTLPTSEYRTAGDVNYYKAAVLRPEAWLKLARGGVDVRRIAGVAKRRLGTLARARLAQGLVRLGLREAPAQGLQADLRTIVRNRVDTLLVLCEDEPTLAYLRTHGAGVEHELEGKGLRTEIVPKVDHTFTPLWSQNAVHELVTTHLVERFGGGSR
jgi:alpha-beta hydrolase superfamily lysophospholipase